MRSTYAPREPLAQELRHTVQVQRRSSTLDDLGVQIDSWTTTASPRAAIKPDGGRELQASQAPLAWTAMLVTVRAPGLTIDPADRLLLSNGDILDIREILDDGLRGRWLYLRCEKTGSTQA